MSSGHIKSAFAKVANFQNPISSSSDSSLSMEEERDKYQRFTADILGKPTRHTAKRHSFSLSPDIEREDSVDADRFIPGAYPVMEKSLADPEQLPTTEHPSGSRVGVGSLPGNISESSVALLPEERIHPDPYLNAGGIPKGRLYRDESPVPMDGSELPIHEHPSGSRVGVGSLPGPNNEFGVAILPEERVHPDPIVGSVYGPELKRDSMHKGRRHGTKKAPQVDKSELPTHEHPSGSRVGVGSLPGSNHEVGVAVLPEERLHPDPIVGDVGLAKFSQPKHKFFKKNKHIGTGRGERGSQLPTQEEPSGSTVGIGSMPGDIHEPGVATLPEERVNGRPYGTMHTGFEEHLKEPRNTKAQPAQRNVKNPSASKARTQTHSKTKPKYELPGNEVPSTSPVGIGSMPGSIHEPGVATLPEERINGRPYGSGHTGFEDTLGHGHTFRSTRTNAGKNAKSRSKSGSKSKTSSKHPTPKITVDAEAKRYLMEQNPIPFESSFNASDASPTGEEVLPGDTIFSATQRAKKKDPSFTHGTLDFGVAPGISTEGQPGASGTAAKTQQASTIPSHAEPSGHSVLETVEGAALGAMHGAENVLHRVEESAKAFIPEMHLPRFAGFGEHAAGGEANQPRRGVTEHPLDTTATSERGRKPSKAGISHPPDKTALPEDRDITEAALGNGTISGRKSRLPPVIQREYHKTPSNVADTNYDLFGDKVDYSEFLYDDDASYESQSISSEKDKNNIKYGRNGVGFSMAPGEDGILPGYPTQDGLNRLIGERMRDDHLRAAAAKNPFRTQTQKDAISEAVQGPLTEPVTSNAFDPYAISDRHPRERREAPIFVGGKPTAADKYEAIFRDEPEETPPIESDISRRNLREKREVPIFKGGKPTASGEYEAIFREEELLPAQFDESRRTRNPQEMREVPVFIGGQSTAAGKYEAVYREEESLPVSDSISHRSVREKREFPVFKSGEPTAAGEYEAVFTDVDDSLPAKSTLSHRHPEEKREIPIFKGGKPAASDKYEAVYMDEEPSAAHTSHASKTGNISTRTSDSAQQLWQQTKLGSHTTHSKKGAPGFKVGYLGKAVSPEEEAIEIERARRAAVRRMGID